MPFLNKIESGNTRIGVWLMSETWQDLYCMIRLTGADKLKFEKIVNPGRKREFLAVRILMAMLIGGQPEILYSGDGKPCINDNSRFISITHSRNIAAVILSERPAGIDTEVTGRKISDIAARFLSENERQWTSKTADTALAQLFCWCCKEAIYKMMNVKELDFRKSISIEPLVIGEQINATAYFVHDGSLTEIIISYQHVENNILVWCVVS